ncbi:hypothetical protein BDZ90DRAFT_232628 [Jaminaea rosea]|uniref:NudC domain-containing protein 1 n=1 Tax=Jaminaea rosea TaxID=1569628 RepID=A0A316UP68_9BASI|nr:hypothetical protein BDZ90DRAFT_232628 [Jaminaea rosea]PWN27070.1 hypothetical protein BDZ90DRAFT_232628 [Jaminaea rosea]
MQGGSSDDVFPVDRSLLNPKFEAYKLLTDGVTSACHHLPSSVRLSAPDGVGFKELQDRLNYNHLVPAASSSSQCVYIDDAGFVILVDFSAGSVKPSFHPLHRLESTPNGCASLVALESDQWLVSDAKGGIVCLETKKQGSRWTAEVVASLKVEGSSRILEARRSETDAAVVLALVQSTRRLATSTDSGGSSKPTRSSKVAFDVSLLELPIPISTTQAPAANTSSTSPEPIFVQPSWTVTGNDPAYHTQLGPSSESQHLLIAESSFEDTATHAARHSAKTQPKPASTSTTPAASSNTDTQAPSPLATTRPLRPPPLFSWHQSSDTVTLLFSLPTSINKGDTRVHFSPPSGLSIHLAPHADLDRAASESKIVELRDDEQEARKVDEEAKPSIRTARALQAGCFANRTLWAPIDTSGCVWTWERVPPAGGAKRTANGQEKVGEQGLLSVFLEKKDEGTRWAAVFDEAERRRRAEANGGDEDDEDDPPETQDPSDLLGMVQGLDKYTAEGEADGDDMEYNPLFSAQRDSLLHDGLEAEDGDVGRRLCVTAVARGGDGQGIAVNHPQSEAGARSQLASCLARPLPQADRSDSDAAALRPLVVRRDLDGLVFFPPSPSSSSAWHHRTTLPALSFVLASKRDLRATYVVPTSRSSSKGGRTAVLAFEDAPRVRDDYDEASKGAGNLFVYYSTDEEEATGAAGKKKTEYAPSRVIRLEGEGGTGSFMGAALLLVDGRRVLAVLCERAMLLLRGVLDDE